MPAETPNPTLPPSRRFSLVIPRPLWIGLATVVMIVIAFGLKFVIPVYLRQTAITEIQRLGGTVTLQPGGPAWLRSRIGDNRMKLFDEVIEVDLDNTAATDVTLRHVGWLSSLQQLYVGSTHVTDSGLEHLQGLRNLQVLWLNNPRVTDAGVRHLRELTSLQTLLLNDTQVTDAGLANLRGLSRLEVLWLDKTPVTDAGLAELRRSLPALHFVHQ